jgi:hypothetical protein
VLTSLTISL